MSCGSRVYFVGAWVVLVRCTAGGGGVISYLEYTYIISICSSLYAKKQNVVDTDLCLHDVITFNIWVLGVTNTKLNEFHNSDTVCYGS